MSNQLLPQISPDSRVTGDFSFKKRFLPLWEKHKVLFAHPCSKVCSQHHIIKWELCGTKAQIIKYVFGFFFSPFFISTEEKARPIPTEAKNSAQAENCKQHKPAIVCGGNNGSFHGVSSLKNALCGPAWDPELTGKVIFVISQHLLGHPHPWLHHNTDNELQLQPGATEKK